MAKKVSIADLKKHFKSKSEKELIEEITSLYKRFANVKDYYASILSPSDSKEVLGRYKDKISKEFFSVVGYSNPKLSNVRKLINEYKKIAPSPQHTIDLLLHVVEEGSAFTSEYGDMTESFYISIEGTFESALNLMVTENSIEHFDDRCRDIVKYAFQGWGFQDGLNSSYDKYIGNREI